MGEPYHNKKIPCHHRVRADLKWLSTTPPVKHIFTANNDSVVDFHLSALIHPMTAWAQIAWLFMKLGQENTDISLTVDVINDLHISAQVQVQQSTLKSYIYYYVPKVQLIRISILFYKSFVFCRM